MATAWSAADTFETARHQPWHARFPGVPTDCDERSCNCHALRHECNNGCYVDNDGGSAMQGRCHCYRNRCDCSHNGGYQSKPVELSNSLKDNASYKRSDNRGNSCRDQPETSLCRRHLQSDLQEERYVEYETSETCVAEEVLNIARTKCFVEDDAAGSEGLRCDFRLDPQEC